MILQALYEYYQRKALDPESNIAPLGFEWKELPFLIVLDDDGRFLHFEDTRTPNGKKLRARKFLVPQSPGKRTAGIRANLLWDNAEYIFGINGAQAKKNSFIETIRRVFPEITSETGTLLRFLETEHSEALEKDPLWKEIQETNPFMSFRFAGCSEILISQVRQYLLSSDTEAAEENVCLITGKKDVIESLHTPLKGIAGANTTGAYIVSFNQPAFRSYGKEQGNNAPVGKKAAFAYTTAINMLTDKDSQNKFRLADCTVLFWAAKKTEFENRFSFFFVGPSKDDPDRNSREIKALYDSVKSGKLSTEGDTDFYVLGLSPNAARLSVRFWKEGTVKDFADNFILHFDDLEIIRGKKDEHEYFSLFNLLANVAFDFKTDNIPPNLGGAIMESALDGTPYPSTLQQQCIRRIRAEQNVNRVRAAILKAYLNRKQRFYNTNQKEITMALDLNNNNQGYLCGRLFSVLEKIQEEAQPGINATIKDRYYGAASSTPVTVFGRLLSLSNHHLAKLNPGRKTNLEKLMQSIIAGISSNGMPAHLSLDDQSRFAIGYYHQRQDFFTAKENNN